MDGSYEAKAATGSETIMRQTTTDDDEAKRKAAEEAAKKAAEEALKKAAEAALKLLAEMKKKVEEMIEAAKQGAWAEVEAARQAIEQITQTYKETITTIANETLKEFPALAQQFQAGFINQANATQAQINNLAYHLSGNDNIPEGFGWRVEISGAWGLGLDVNVDAVYKLPESIYNGDLGDFDIFLTPGVQGNTYGVAASTGPLVIFNLPTLDDYKGWGGTLGGALFDGLGGEAEVSRGLFPNSEGSYTWTWHAGAGIGTEASPVSVTVGNTYSVSECVNAWNGIFQRLAGGVGTTPSPATTTPTPTITPRPTLPTAPDTELPTPVPPQPTATQTPVPTKVVPPTVNPTSPPPSATPKPPSVLPKSGEVIED